MKRFFFILVVFSTACRADISEFNWENEQTPNSGKIQPYPSPQPSRQPLPPIQPSQPMQPPQSIQPPSNISPSIPSFPEGFGRIRSLIDEMRSRFFPEADAFFSDTDAFFFNADPFFNNSFPTSPFFPQPNPALKTPIPPSSSPLHSLSQKDGIKIIEKKDLIIVELPLKAKASASDYNISVNGRILTISNSNEQNEETQEENSYRNYRSYSSSSLSRQLPAEVEENFNRLTVGDRLILTFRKK